MVDVQTVCCMCGDVGFPDKLFRCFKCRTRFQHSYCSNYYSEQAEPIEMCDWCQCEQRNKSSSSSPKQGKSLASNSPRSNKSGLANEQRSAYSGEKIKRHDRDESGSGVEKPAVKTPSPRTATRRYKLLKDVMC